MHELQEKFSEACLGLGYSLMATHIIFSRKKLYDLLNSMGVDTDNVGEYIAQNLLVFPEVILLED